MPLHVLVGFSCSPASSQACAAAYVEHQPSQSRVCRCFDDVRSREAVLRTLVNRACSGGDAIAADAAAAGPDRAHGAPPKGLHGAGTLLDVLQPLPDCYGPALLLMASNAQTALQQVLHAHRISRQPCSCLRTALQSLRLHHAGKLACSLASVQVLVADIQALISTQQCHHVKPS